MTGGLSLRQFKPKGFGNNVLADHIWADIEINIVMIL